MDVSSQPKKAVINHLQLSPLSPNTAPQQEVTSEIATL